MSLTLAQLRARVLRMLNETSANNRIDASGTTNLDAEMEDVFNELAVEYATFLYTKVVPVAESTNVLDLSDIVPTAAKLGFGTTNNGWYERIHDLQFQRSESGAVTTDTVAGAVVTITSTAHGLAADDIIYIYNTETYNGKHTVASAPTDDTFTIAATNSEDAETGAWVKASNYWKRSLSPIPWETVEGLFTTPDNPSAGESPQGTLWITWVCAPGDLPASAVVPSYHFPDTVHGLIADVTATRFMENLADALRGEPRRRVEQARRYLEENKAPDPPVFFGNYKFQNGVYSFIKRTERALIIYPGMI